MDKEKYSKREYQCPNCDADKPEFREPCPECDYDDKKMEGVKER